MRAAVLLALARAVGAVVHVVTTPTGEQSWTTLCSSGATIAYASTCQRDQNDRPILGHANFCPSQLSTAASDWEEQRATAVHELLHALGFSSDSWSSSAPDQGLWLCLHGGRRPASRGAAAPEPRPTTT